VLFTNLTIPFCFERAKVIKSEELEIGL